MSDLQRLREWLDRGGQWTVRAIRCPRCRAAVARGWSAEICAFLVLIDPVPLTPLGEFEALLDGIPTYTAWRVGGVRVDLRTAARRTQRLAHDVWPEHRCGHLHLHTTQSQINPPSNDDSDPDAPPPF